MGSCTPPTAFTYIHKKLVYPFFSHFQWSKGIKKQQPNRHQRSTDLRDSFVVVVVEVVAVTVGVVNVLE